MKQLDIRSLIGGSIEQVIEEKELSRALSSKKKLRVYFGIDPTGDHIHLGHTIPLFLLRKFQDAGHQAILLIGDFTAQIGDPSGRDKQRRVLGKEQIKQNYKNYAKQAGKILDMDNLEVVYNSAWHAKETKQEFFQHAYLLTVNQLKERELFKRREKADNPISLAEFCYPYLQGYDAVKLRADVQIGGSDQLFNMLVSRDLVRKMLGKTQSVITTKLISGTNGQKMSKSFANTVPIDRGASEMFGSLMSVTDDIMGEYGKVFLNWSGKSQLPPEPKERKLLLARSITTMFFGKDEAQKANENFERVFSRKLTPRDIAECYLGSPMPLGKVLVKCGLVLSMNQARRVIEQKGVKLNKKLATDVQQIVKGKGQVLQVGKRKFVRLLS